MQHDVEDPRYVTPRHIEIGTEKWLGRMGQFDLWHGTDDEGDEVVVTVLGRWPLSTLPPTTTVWPLEHLNGLSPAHERLDVRAALEAARRAGKPAQAGTVTGMPEGSFDGPDFDGTKISCGHEFGPDGSTPDCTPYCWN